jgi:hypothetical protein
LKTKCVFWFSLQLFCETLLIIRWNEWDMIKNVYWSSCSVPVIFFLILMILEFSQQIFRKILKYQISWKSIQWEPSNSMRTDGRIYMTKLIVAFCNFADAPNKGGCVSCHFLRLGPSFGSRPGHVKFVLYQVTLRQVSLKSISAFVCGYYSSSAM